MDAQRWRQVEAVLDRALDADPAEWPALLDEACANDPALRHEVEALLAEHGRHERVLADHAGDVAAALLDEAEEARDADRLLGERLGAWRVIRQIGHGGTSRVFLGERADGEFAQQVAVKVLRAGLDTAADREGFRAERRILASLGHPNIARLLDGGVTPDGRPYLVLEYVEGEPLTAYAEARGLDVAGRLRLFLQVADAMQAAHRQLVVHRDLKPSNILVPADGRPRLLDFGVAKILDPARGDRRETTRRRWFTPAYAAPEQYTGAPITTATDVYQLGAVLYELLCGRRPLEPADVRRPPSEALAPHDDPPPPSAHAPALRGDLDAVVLRALRKEPNARYASVEALAADVRRALDGEPVAARAGERAYRWQRWARRRALPLAAAAAAVVIALTYGATLVVQNRRIARALAESTAERERAEQVTAFLYGLFQDGDPRRGRGDTITARALLERGEARANALARQPVAQAAMLEVIGRARGDLGAFDEARPSLERALAIRRQVLGDSHPDAAQSRASLAKLDERVGRFADAERGYRAALAVQRSRLGDTSVATQQSLLDLASALHAAGRYQDAGRIFAEWERIAAVTPRRRDERTATQLHLLGDYVEAAAYGDSAALARAERYYRDAIDIRREQLGERDPRVALTEARVAHVRWERGAVREAEADFARALATLRTAYPGGHPDLAQTLFSLGTHLQDDGRAEAAVPPLREAAAMVRRHSGDEHPQVAAYLAAYGDALRVAGDHPAAERALRDAEARLRRQVGEQNVMTVRARSQLGSVLRALGRTGEAESLLLASYQWLAAERGAAHAQTQFALGEVVKLYETLGRGDDATRYRALLTPVARR